MSETLHKKPFDGGAEHALETFWAVVNAQHPAAKTGDLSPEAESRLATAAEMAVSEWVRNNIPASDVAPLAGNLHFFTAVSEDQLEQIDTAQDRPTHVGLIIAQRAMRAADAAALALQVAGQPDASVKVAGCSEIAFDGEIDDHNFYDTHLVVTAGTPGEIAQRFIECEYELPDGGVTTFTLNVTDLQPITAGEYAKVLEALRSGALVPSSTLSP